MNLLKTSVLQEAARICRENNIHVIPGSCPAQFLNPDFGHKLMRGLWGFMGNLKVEMPSQSQTGSSETMTSGGSSASVAAFLLDSGLMSNMMPRAPHHSIRKEHYSTSARYAN